MKRKQRKRRIRRILLAFLFIQISISSYGQIFIPIFLNSSQKYICKPRNKKAVKYYNKAFDYYNKNIYISIEYFKGAIEEDSLFCDAYFNLIKSYNKTKDYKSALNYTDLALKTNSFDIWLIKAKGFLLYKLKEYQKASEYFEELIEKQPRNALWYYYSAESLIKLDLLDSAKVTTIKMETIINQSYNTDYKVLSYYLQGKIAYHKNEFALAQRAFSMIKNSFKKNGEFCYYYGMTFIHQGEAKKAKKYIKRSVRYGYDLNEEELKHYGLEGS